MVDNNPLKIEFNDDGDPSGIGEFKAGDTIVSSLLPSGVRDVVAAVETTSGLWNEGGEATVPDAVSGLWQQTYDVSKDNSGFWISVFDSVSATSGTWNTGGEATITDAVSGLWQQTYVVTRDTSADLREASSTLESFSGSVETSVGDIGGPSAAGFAGWNSTKTTVDGGASNWNVIYGDRANILTTSANVVAIGGPSALGYSNWNAIYADRANILTTSANVVAIGGPSATGFAGWNSTKTTVDGGASNWNVIYGDRANILTTSANVVAIGGPSATGFAGWNSTESTVDNGSAFWASSIASGVGVYMGSSVVVSGFGAGDAAPAPAYGSRLAINTTSQRLMWVKGAFTQNEMGEDSEGEWITDNNSNFNMGNSNFSGTNLNIITRNISVGNSLSAHANAAVQFDPSTITVSSCPVPPPWSFVEVTADDGQNTGDPYYFASGSSHLKTEIDAAYITWSSAGSYFIVASAGYYEFEMQGSIVVGSSPTDVTTSIVQTTGLGGAEVEKIDKLQRIRTNIDPHDIMIKWVGYCEAANFTCKLDGDNTVRMEKGSTFTCKRIN